jgi:hypothetical protein
MRFLNSAVYLGGCDHLVVCDIAGHRTTRTCNNRIEEIQMARRSQESSTAQMSKADAIRDAVSRLGRKARPRDVIADLAEKGVTVTSPQVSSLMKKLGIKRRRRGGRVATNGAVRQTSTGAKRGPRAAGGLTASDLLDAKKLADQLGGVDKLKKALDLLEQLQ